MTKKTGNIRRLLLPAAAAMCFAVVFSWSASAFAAAGDVPGCDKRIMDAMEAKGNARVAYDVASTENVIDKPDSILAMTCFNNGAGNASKNLGKIFSGDYTPGLTPIIPDSLTSFYDDFKLSMGNRTGKVDYTQTALGTNISACNATQDLWTESNSEAVRPGIPYALMDDLKTGTAPTGISTVVAGSNFEKDWNQSQADNDFANLNTDIGLLPKAWTAAPGFMASPVNTDTSCAVLAKIGNAPTPCP